MNAEIVKAIFACEMRAKLEDYGFRVSASASEKFTSLMNNEFEIFRRAVNAAKLKPE